MSIPTQIGVRVRRERWWGKTTWTEGSKYPPTHLAIPLDAATLAEMRERIERRIFDAYGYGATGLLADGVLSDLGLEASA